MKREKISETIEHINTKYIDEAIMYKGNSKAGSKVWVRWGSIAACLAVFVIAGAILPSLLGRNGIPGQNAGGRYKTFTLQSNESAIVWPWEYRATCEQYTELTLGGTDYRGRGRAVPENLVGEPIGTSTVVGYDIIKDEKHTSNFEVYQLKYADKSQFVAVKMDGIYYVFKNDRYAPPDTLGELFELVDLSKAIKISHFSENGDSPDNKHFSLNSDDYIWEVLASCKNAEFIDNQERMIYESKNYLSFSITSDTLGIYKRAMYITEEGYLWTNAFDWQYAFDIGKDAAEKIINYAKENSAKATYEPYHYSIYGKVVEISDDYMLVDDSILCKNPADGITYKVLLNDLRISRYIQYGVIAVGDIVQISYEGEINAENEHTVDRAYYASKMVISGRDILIIE